MQPLLQAALASGFKNGSFVTDLNNGSMGALAAGVANNETFFCNVVGQSFGPCATAGLGPGSSSYPANLVEVNPVLEGDGGHLAERKRGSSEPTTRCRCSSVRRSRMVWT